MQISICDWPIYLTASADEQLAWHFMTRKVKLDGYENYMQIRFEFISFVFKFFIGCVFCMCLW